MRSIMKSNFNKFFQQNNYKPQKMLVFALKRLPEMDKGYDKIE